MKKLRCLAIISLFCFSACNKKENGPTKTDLLTTGQWKLSSALFIGAGKSVDYVSLAKDCEKDNLTNFVKGGTISVDEGITKCRSAAPQVDSNAGFWLFSKDDKKLKLNLDFTGVPLDGNFNVDTLTSTTIYLTLDTATVFGPTTINLTFSK